MRKIHFILMILLLSFLATAGAGLFWLWENDPYQVQMELQGDRQIVMEYGQEYEEPGAQAQATRMFFKRGVEEVEVVRTGAVDTQKLGNYELQYTASIGDASVTQSRYIQIVDKTPPRIFLSGGEEYHILPGTLYEEPGFFAVDTYDGDLTDSVLVARHGDVITYSVTDNSGNLAIVRRTIKVVDAEPPQITLLGEEYVEVSAGGFYEDMGCIATDNRDGEITHRVEVSSKLNLFKPGKYTIVYKVSDLFGNEAEVTRTVKVRKIKGLKVGKYNGKQIYLTFDDGPGKYTEQLLDVLKKYDIRATFFVLDTDYAHLLTRMAQEGHTVAIHAAQHDYGYLYSDEETYFEDLDQISDIIEDRTGVKPKLLRFPGGSSNLVSKDYNKGIMTRLTEQVEDKGYTYFDWNVDSNDAGGARTAQQVFDNVTKGIEKYDQSVVLQHDIKSFSVEAVEEIIRWGLKNGYKFLPLTEESPTCHHDINN